MSEQEKFAANREAIGAIKGASSPNTLRCETAFRRYLAAVAYHDDQNASAHRHGPDADEHDAERREDFGAQTTRWDLQDASVRDVMTRDVVCVEDTAPFKEIVDTLTSRHISAVPVVDADHVVVGIVSESDLLAKLVTGGELRARIKGAWRTRGAIRRKSQADTAAGLMTTPVVTTTPDTPIVHAARVAATEFVRRMPVVDESGALVGIVTRSDMLRVFDRSDEDIRAHIVEDILHQDLCINPITVGVTVERGVVTLSGELEKEGLVRLVLAAVRATIGVVSVHNELSFRLADAPPTPVIGPMY